MTSDMEGGRGKTYVNPMGGGRGGMNGLEREKHRKVGAS